MNSIAGSTASRHGKTIQDGGCVRPVADDHVVSVGAMDFSCIGNYAVRVGDIILIDVSAEYRNVGLPIALLAGSLGHAKTTVERHAAFQLEGAGLVRAGRIEALRHPDFVSRGCTGEGILQVTGVGPRIAGAGS